MDKAFQDIKAALLSAPALSLPDVTKPFLLYVDENRGVAKGCYSRDWDLGKDQWHIFQKNWTQWLVDDLPACVWWLLWPC